MRKLQMHMQWQLQVQSRVLNSMMNGGGMPGSVASAMAGALGGDGGIPGFGVGPTSRFAPPPAARPPASAPASHMSHCAVSASAAAEPSLLGVPAAAPCPTKRQIEDITLPVPEPMRPFTPSNERALDEESVAETLSIDDLIGGLAY